MAAPKGTKPPAWGKGRPKGSPNKISAKHKEWCRKMLADKTYRQGLEKRLHEGKLAPPLEAMVWHYAYGKPIETHEISGDLTVRQPIDEFHSS